MFTNKLHSDYSSYDSESVITGSYEYLFFCQQGKCDSNAVVPQRSSHCLIYLVQGVNKYTCTHRLDTQAP